MNLKIHRNPGMNRRLCSRATRLLLFYFCLTVLFSAGAKQEETPLFALFLSSSLKWVRWLRWLEL